MIPKLQPKNIVWGIDPNNEPKAFQVDMKWNIKTSMTDEAWNTAFLGAFSELLVWTKKTDISVQFQYNLLNTEFDLNPNTSITTGDWIKVSLNSYAEVSSATTWTAIIESRDSIAYEPWHTGFADFTWLFIWTWNGWVWPHDNDDWFPLKIVNWNASFWYLKSWVEKWSGWVNGFDDQANWNWTLKPELVDFSKVNIFRVTFWYLWVANPTLWIRLDKWYTLHTVLTEWRLEWTHLDNPVFPIRIKAENWMIVRSWSWNGWNIWNWKRVSSRGFTFPNTMISDWVVTEEQWSMDLVSTNVWTIALFRSKALYGWKKNKVKARLLSYEFNVDIPAWNIVWQVVFQIVRVSTLSWVWSFTSINNNSSIMEYDYITWTWASVNILTSNPLITKTVQYVWSSKWWVSWSASIDAKSLWAFAYSWDIFWVIAKDLWWNSVTVRIDMNWEEIF